MKVKVERIRRGRRKVEVEYIDIGEPRKYRPAAQLKATSGAPAAAGSRKRNGGRALRLPWQHRESEG